MDVLVSGSDRAPLRLPAPPPALVAVTAALLLLAGVLAVGPVRSAAERAASVDDVRVDLRLLASTREYGGSLYGTLGVVVRDPRDDVQVRAVEVEVPGVHHAPARGLPAVVQGGELLVPLRFVVFSCSQLALPGRVVLQAARGERPAQVAHRPLTLDGDGAALLVACGRLPQPGLGAPE